MAIHVLDLPPISDREYERAAGGHACTVVLGYDGTQSSRIAARRAGELAGRDGRVLAIHAVTGADTTAREAFAGLDTGALGGAGIETRVAEGDAVEALASAAVDAGARYIVLGWSETDPGRVCAALMDRGVAPVTVVPPERAGAP